MTPAQRDLANYVVAHSEKVAFMTAKQLAAATGQSDAAVIRFAQAAGFTGFPHLRETLRTGLLERVGASGMRRKAGTSKASELKETVFGAEAALVEQAAKLNSDADVVRVADLLIRARRIWVTGHGTSYPLALYLSMHLNLVLDKASIFNIEHGDVADRFRSVAAADVFVGIGYVRYLPYTVEMLRLARDSGATVVAITDRVSSPLARVAHHSLYVARSESSLVWWSQAGTLVLVDWLTALITIRDRTAVARNLRRSDDELKRLGFWNAGDAVGEGRSLEQHLDETPQEPGSRPPVR